MVLKFTKDLRLFAPDLNNLSNQLRFGVKLSTDCLVTEKGVPDMSVDVAAGTIIFDAADVVVAGQNVVITASDPTNDRIDLIVVDNAGTASVITGTAAATPKAPNYDPAVYLPLARVFVDDGVTSILNAKITDIRIHNTGVGAGIQMEEQDGVPTVANVNTIKVTNGSLTDEGAGVVSLETGVGGTNIYTEPFVGQTTVTVTHNLADVRPIVQVYDNNNEQVTTDKIDIIDLNNVQVDFAVATTGFVVVHGGTAELKQGGVGTYLHEQTVGAAAWNVTHNLNSDTPVVQVFDSSGDVVEPTSIDITGVNTLTVNFGSAQTGKVRVLAGFFSGVVYQNVDLLPETDDTYDIGSPSFRWQDIFLSGTMTIDGDILPETDNSSDIGSGSNRFKDLYLSGTITVDGDILPETHNTSDLGTTGTRFKDGFFQGDVDIAGKLTVAGGVDPTYLQLDPQASAPAVNNSLWIDSTDSFKLKLKDNSGNSYSVSPPLANGYIKIESMFPDPTNPPGSSVVGVNPSVDFDDTTDEIAYFSFQTPVDLDDTADIVFEIAYCMASANTSDDVVLGLDANAIADGEDSTPSIESQTTQTITVPDTAEQMDIVTTTSLKIPASLLSGTQIISCKFYRDANAGGDTAAGDFLLLNIRAKYTRK
jgi:hypothetical protein